MVMEFANCQQSKITRKMRQLGLEMGAIEVGLKTEDKVAGQSGALLLYIQGKQDGAQGTGEDINRT